jgi:hypothetical protein
MPMDGRAIYDLEEVCDQAHGFFGGHAGGATGESA